jgi:UDPglucose 6-dehydrogenase
VGRFSFKISRPRRRPVSARADLPRTTDVLNRAVVHRVLDFVAGVATPGCTIAVLGLSYKPSSHVVEESQAIYLVKTLVDHHYRVVAYDPLAGPTANQELRGRALILDSPAECIRDADVVLIATPDPQFAALSGADFATRRRRPSAPDTARCQSIRQPRRVHSRHELHTTRVCER